MGLSLRDASIAMLLNCCNKHIRDCYRKLKYVLRIAATDEHIHTQTPISKKYSPWPSVIVRDSPWQIKKILLKHILDEETNHSSHHSDKE